MTIGNKTINNKKSLQFTLPRLTILVSALFTFINAPALSEIKRDPARIIPYAPQEVRTSLQEFLKARYPGNWVIERLPHGGIKKLSGGRIPLAASNLQSSYHFLMLAADHLEIDATQIDPNHAETSKSDEWTNYYFNQVLDGYPVYGGKLIVKVRNVDSAIIEIENALNQQLRAPASTPTVTNSNEAPLYLQMKKGAVEAKAQINEDLAEQRLKVTDQPPELVIFPGETSAGLNGLGVLSELSWRFKVKSEKSADLSDVYYGASTGKILKVDQKAAPKN